MGFLYGDLTPAPFATNFLEELRDVVDLCGTIADLDQAIVTADERRDALRHRAADDMARVDALASAVLAAADASDKGDEGSPAMVLATGLAEALAERRAAVEASIRKRLETDLAADEAATLAARREYFPVLERYFLSKQLPGARTTWKISLSPAAKKDERRYFGIIGGESDVGLDWSIELDVPTEGPWTQPLRVDRVVEDGISILAPQLSGLIKKDVKEKKQKLDKHVITNVVDDGTRILIEIRADVGEPEGFDLAVTNAARTLEIVKTGAEDDASVGAFEPVEEDAARLLELAERVRELMTMLVKKRLVAARFEALPFDGTNVESQPRLVEIVPRLVANVAPLVSEIATRSRSDEELVLRRILNDDRREELFMSKARLREELHGLDIEHRALFTALEQALDATRANGARAVSDAPPPIRAEVPPSGRPARRESGSMGAVIVPLPVSPPAAPPAPASSEDPVLEVKEEEEEEEDIDEQEELDEQEEQEEPVQEAERLSEAPALSTRMPELVATLKQILAMTKDGRNDEALRHYAELFASAQFAMCAHDDQRKALKLLLHGGPAPTGDDPRAAFRAALPILQALVLHHRDPADYEMLGMAYVALEEPAKATEMYKKALEIERARNPSSDLCGTLMRRVSEL